jgi:hypothetical protein
MKRNRSDSLEEEGAKGPDMVCVRVGQAKFRVAKSLFLPPFILPQLADSKLVKDVSSGQSLSYERIPRVFEDVLDYYRGGFLRETAGFDLRVLVKEWDFWGISPIDRILAKPPFSAEDTKEQVESAALFVEDLLSSCASRWPEDDILQAGLRLNIAHWAGGDLFSDKKPLPQSIPWENVEWRTQAIVLAAYRKLHPETHLTQKISDVIQKDVLEEASKMVEVVECLMADLDNIIFRRLVVLEAARQGWVFDIQHPVDGCQTKGGIPGGFWYCLPKHGIEFCGSNIRIPRCEDDCCGCNDNFNVSIVIKT